MSTSLFNLNLHFPKLQSHLSFVGFDKFPSYSHVNFIRKQRCRLPSVVVNASSELPLLPFNINEILIPSETKTLHLYEARYIALLEESLFKKKKLFVHFVLDPIAISDSKTEASFAARYGCLVHIEKVTPRLFCSCERFVSSGERHCMSLLTTACYTLITLQVDKLDVGALISIRGISRVKIVNFLQAEPYLKGMVMPVQDIVPESTDKVDCKAKVLKEALYRLNSLEIKMKIPKEQSLQTHTANSLNWAQEETSLEIDGAFIPSFPERLSFAALQPVSGSSQSELLKLQQDKRMAMDLKDTLERLGRSIEIVQNNVSLVAAKLAIQSL